MQIHEKITTRGNYEQEKAYLFNGLYNNQHIINKNTIQKYKNFENKLKNKLK